MIDKNTQIRNSFSYLLPVILKSLLPLMAIPVFTRILTKEEFGILALAQVYAIFMAGIANLGLTSAFDRNFFKYRGTSESSAVFYTNTAFVAFNIIILLAITYIIKSYVSNYLIGDYRYSNLIFWSLCATGLTSVRTFYLNYYRNMNDANRYVKFTVVEAIFTTLLSIILVAFFKVGVYGIVWGQFLSNLVILIIMTASVTKIMPITFRMGILKESLKLGLPLTPRVFLGVISGQFDKFMIGLLGTVGGVGIYSISQRASYLVFSFMSALSNVHKPQVFEKMFDGGKEGGREVGRYLTPFAFVSVGFALLVSLFSEEFIIILTPKEYHGAIDIIIILSMYFSLLFLTMHPQLLYAKKTYISSILTTISISINVAINIPFITLWGAMGAAWATLISGMISGSITFIVSQHYYRIHYEAKKMFIIYFIHFSTSLLLLYIRSISIGYDYRVTLKIFAILTFIAIGNKINILNGTSLRAVISAFKLRKFSLRNIS